MNISETFYVLGLKPEHADIYLANLNWGETSITNIARKSGIPRTSIYSLLPELIESGLITQTVKQGSTLYKAADPEQLLDLLEQQKLRLDQSITQLSTTMDQLKALQKKATPKPSIQYLDGPEGIKKAYSMTLSANEIDIQCFSDNYMNIVSEEFFNNYFDEFHSSQIKSREILSNSDADKEYAKRRGNKFHRMAHTDNVADSETDFWVYNHTVCFVSFNEKEPYALLIEDEDIAKCMKSIFQNAWENLQR